MRRPLLRFVPMVAALPLVLAPGASAHPGDCDAGARPPRDLPLVLPDGSRLTVHDRAGGLLTAPRFRFTLRGAEADLAGAGTVRWYLDDRRVEADAQAPYGWRGRTDRFRAGRRTVTVQAEVRDGVIATTSFTVRIVRCGS